MAKPIDPAFIEAAKSRLLAQQEEITQQIADLSKDDPFSDPDHTIDNAAVDTDVREQIGHDTLEAEIKDLKSRLSDIEIALKKVEKRTYGICEKCSSVIVEARLDLVPEARCCIDCERKLHQ